MIIDFHTHTFPDKIANHVISTLSKSATLTPFSDGTCDGLINNMKEQGVDLSVVLPIATKESQTDTINRTAIEVNEFYDGKGIISFGSLHPNNENYSQIIKSLASNGVKGIKLHPVFQRVVFDDIRYMRIVDCACSNDMIILVHGGYDASFPGEKFVTDKEVKNVMKELNPTNMIMAHMGAWGFWDEMLEVLKEYKVMMDTSFTMTQEAMGQILTPEKFVQMVRLAGAQNVFYGSDSPWNRLDDSVDVIKNSGLTKEECDLILGENAARILKL